MMPNNWSLFDYSPIELNKFMNKKVKIVLRNGDFKIGIICSVDPVSRSFLMICGFCLELIIGYSILNIINEDLHNYQSPKMFNFSKKFENISNEDLEKKLESRLLEVTCWFRKNFISFKISEKVIIVEDVVKITPPYKVGDVCCANNQILLDKMQKILSSIP